MSGVAIIRALLSGYAPLMAIAPNVKVFAGGIPQGTVLPALNVSSISTNENPTTARGLSIKMQRERVQVTVLTSNDYPLMKRILKASSLGAGVHTGQVLGYRVCSIIPAGENSEIPVSDDRIYEQSRDFMVTFIEAN